MRAPSPSSPVAGKPWRVAILLCTKDGAAHLEAQLASYAGQTHPDWELHVSDDGSNDATRVLIARFAAGQPQPVQLRDGPRQGFCRNFMALAADPAVRADGYAFSDQDDIWYPDKLERALRWLAGVPPHMPAMYCSRTELVDAKGRHLGHSLLFSRPPAFANALVQNIGGGNTMVFNQAAKRLLEASGALDVVSHDWWTYQIVTAAGGRVHYDPLPSLKYRQHGDNILGSNMGTRARLARLRMVFAGRLIDWNDRNIAALQASGLLAAGSLTTLEFFARARAARWLGMRLVHLWRSGVYRQTVFGSLGLIAAACLRRI
ncbi:MAG: glycosyltransferase family 2 protein [Xanthobacteraceae bacterium]|nr:MAG: glycosyltransferase family 2 protein [Xanthobacteraceae bacterium]